MGVEEENGIAKRPVKGVSETDIARILKEMIGYDAKISPAYLCKVSPEEIDGKTILVIWVPAGINRPYSVMESVVANRSTPKFYIRSKSSTIEAKGEILDEVRELANRVPFDERGNTDIGIEDISGIRVYEHLKSIESKLADEFGHKSLMEILDEMDLLTGPVENRQIKNVAAMMFCDHPEKFFPVTQVDIVHFPGGSIENPDIIIEAPKITGPVPKIINDTLSYLRTNVIKQRISKPSDNEKSIKVFNYPYQALEEAVVNALYHRDYREREPVEITIEPSHIDILSYAGPDRSISTEAIRTAKKLKARRYRNRRLGDFLKELGLTEGRATGIPTIQKHLNLNGNSPAVIETDDDRTYFLLTIRCRKDMIELNDTTANPQRAEAPLHKIMTHLENELANNDLQVYISNIKDVTTLKNKLSHLISKVYLQVWKNSKTDLSLLISDLLRVLLLISQKGATSNEILNAINLDSLYKLRRYILAPALSTGYIGMSNPSKPTSSKQRYSLTESGLSLFK